MVAHGLSPLHWLAQRNADAAVLTPLVSLLVRAGADVEARELIYGACAPHTARRRALAR